MSPLSSELLKSIATLAEIAAVLFTALGALFGVTYFLASRPLRKIEDREKAELVLNVAKAQEESAKASERASLANERAAANEKEAEAERLARVKIEAAVAWRQLSEQDKLDIGAVARGFKSLVGAGVWFNTSSTEAEMFADDIAEALRLGQVVVQPPAGLLEMKLPGKFGDPIRTTANVYAQSVDEDVRAMVEQDERETGLAEIEAMFEQEERKLRLMRADGVGGLQ